MYCHCCRCHVTAVRPKTLLKVLNVFFWLASLTVAVGFSLLAGLNIVLAPAAIVIGMSVGVSARRLNTWTCPRCGAELVETQPDEPPVALVIPEGPPAPVGFMP